MLLVPLGARPALDLLATAAARGWPALPALQRLACGLAGSLRSLRDVGPRSVCLIVTLAIWLTHGWVGYLAAIAVAGDLTFVATALAGAASNLAFALPVTGVGGLGPPQAAWSSALQLAGASWEVGVATALLAYGCLLAGGLLTAAATLLFPAPSLRLAEPAPLEPL